MALSTVHLTILLLLLSSDVILVSPSVFFEMTTGTRRIRLLRAPSRFFPFLSFLPFFSPLGAALARLLQHLFLPRLFFPLCLFWIHSSPAPPLFPCFHLSSPLFFTFRHLTSTHTHFITHSLPGVLWALPYFTAFGFRDLLEDWICIIDLIYLFVFNNNTHHTSSHTHIMSSQTQLTAPLRPILDEQLPGQLPGLRAAARLKWVSSSCPDSCPGWSSEIKPSSCPDSCPGSCSRLKRSAVRAAAPCHHSHIFCYESRITW